MKRKKNSKHIRNGTKKEGKFNATLIEIGLVSSRKTMM